jgi:Xaa-Pro dipeptidase
MALQFDPEEYAARLSKLTASMREEKIDAMLLFAQESMYWLTGYDTFGFCFFQCLVVKANGNMVLLTRSADLRQARHTSNIEQIVVWTDRSKADPALDLKNLLSDLDLLGARIGVEYDTHGLTGANCRKLDNQLHSFAELIDASYIVSRLRLIKSPAEIAYARRAAELADAALDAAMPLIKPGANEADILAAMQGAVFCRRRRLSRPTSSSSAPARTRFCAATSPDAARSMPTTSSRSNGPAATHITMPP